MAFKLAAHFFRFGGAMIDKVHINQIRLKRRGGRFMWVKRRRRGNRVLAFGAKLFFRLAGNQVPVVGDSRVWRQQEVTSFRLLNLENFFAFSGNEVPCGLSAYPVMTYTP
jgi:hypothetical protein